MIGENFFTNNKNQLICNLDTETNIFHFKLTIYNYKKIKYIKMDKYGNRKLHYKNDIIRLYVIRGITFPKKKLDEHDTIILRIDKKRFTSNFIETIASYVMDQILKNEYNIQIPKYSEYINLVNIY